MTALDQGHVPDASSSVRHLLRHAVEETIGSHASTTTASFVNASDTDKKVVTERLINNTISAAEISVGDGTKSDAAILTMLDALCQRRLSTREPVQVYS